MRKKSLGLLIMVLLIGAIGLTACGKDKKVNIEGKWLLESMISSDGEVITAEEIAESISNEMFVKFEKNGKAELSLFESNDNIEYIVDGLNVVLKITMYDEGDPIEEMTGVIEDGKLILKESHEDAESMVFVKEK